MAPDYGKMKIAELKKRREPALCAVRDCLVPVWPGPDKIAPKINK